MFYKRSKDLAFLFWQVISVPTKNVWFLRKTHDSFLETGFCAVDVSAGTRHASRVQEYVSEHWGKAEEGKLAINHEKSKLYLSACKKFAQESV